MRKLFFLFLLALLATPVLAQQGTATGPLAPCSAFGTAAGACAQGGIITAAGPTGSATITPIITYNAAGQLTTVSSATIAPSVGSVTGLGAGVATLLGGTASGTGGPVGTVSPSISGTMLTGAITAVGIIYTHPNSQYAFQVGNAGSGTFYWGAATSGANPDAVWSNNAGTERMRVTDAGGLVMAGIPSSTTAQTGTMCWSAAAFTYDPSLGCLTSLEEDKNIKSGISGWEAKTEGMKLKPFWFTKKGDWGNSDLHEQPGLGAHATEKVDARLVGYGTDGKLRGVRYAEMVALLISWDQEQEREITYLKWADAVILLIFSGLGLWILAKSRQLRYTD